MPLAPECVFKWDGAALSIVLFAIPVAVLITTLTLFLYRKAVERAMRSSAGERIAAGAPPPVATAPAAPLRIAVATHDDHSILPPVTQSRAAMRRLSAVYLVAGFIQSVLITILWFGLNDIEFRSVRFLLTWLPWSWPIVLTLTLTGTATRRQRRALVVAYFIVLLLADAGADVFGLRFEPGFGELFLLWALVMGPPTLVIVLLSNRAWRSVGLIALFLGIVLSAGFQLGFQGLGCLVLTTRSSALLHGFEYLLIAVVVLCVALAWWGLKRLVRRYEAKRYSDQMLVLDSWWLLVTLFQVLFQLGVSGLATFSLLFAFAAYKAMSRIGLQRIASSHGDARPRALLMLRVFGHTRRTRRLTDQVGQFWRYSGPINMIAGTDLATSLIEPDELIRFWSGRLRQTFIANDADLRSRLTALDTRRDPDGRYRINEFFCHDNTWQATVHALAQRSSVVLMDLRGFGMQNRGCEFELGLLLDEVPLARIVLVIDDSTRLDELTPLLQSAWSRLPDSSPNRALPQPTLQLLQAGDEGRTLERVLSRLYASADRG